MTAKMIDLDGEGGIIADQPTISRVNVRFPTEAEQEAGMTEVPRSIRLEEDAEYGQ